MTKNLLSCSVLALVPLLASGASPQLAGIGTVMQKAVEAREISGAVGLALGPVRHRFRAMLLGDRAHAPREHRGCLQALLVGCGDLDHAEDGPIGADEGTTACPGTGDPEVALGSIEHEQLVDLVGDKLREVFKTPDLGINWFDEKTNLVHALYVYEHNVRLTIEPYEPTLGGMFETMSKTRQLLLLMIL